jgi:N4-gp56 family major capsid protein
MAGGQNLAIEYSTNVDERFTRESQISLALSNNYDFKGDKTVVVYSIPIVPMGDYVRNGSNRYGTPADLSRNKQTLTVTQDRAFTFIMDAGDKIQSEMVSDAGKALSRQLAEVVVPEFDTYCFKKLAEAAQNAGNYDNTVLTKQNAYEYFLKGMEKLGDNNVPDAGRVAFCTYKFANLLKQDAAFMKYSDQSQQMILKGVIGEVDGCKIVKVPSSRLPAGAAFLITHSIAATAPKQLEDYRIHDNPPGISGWLVEGRFIYDCFVLNEKVNAIYYHGGQTVLKNLSVVTSPTDAGKTTVVVNGVKEGAKWYYMTAATRSALTAVTAGTAINTSGWTELTANGLEITPTSSHKYLRLVDVDSSNKPLSVGDAILNIGE